MSVKYFESPQLSTQLRKRTSCAEDLPPWGHPLLSSNIWPRQTLTEPVSEQKHAQESTQHSARLYTTHLVWSKRCVRDCRSYWPLPRKRSLYRSYRLSASWRPTYPTSRVQCKPETYKMEFNLERPSRSLPVYHILGGCHCGWCLYTLERHTNDSLDRSTDFDRSINSGCIHFMYM